MVAATAGPVELIYIDPPYNARQYSGYYHVPEVIARGWFDGVPVLRGKTGLVNGSDQQSDWCSARKAGGRSRNCCGRAARDTHWSATIRRDC